MYQDVGTFEVQRRLTDCLETWAGMCLPRLQEYNFPVLVCVVYVLKWATNEITEVVACYRYDSCLLCNRLF